MTRSTCPAPGCQRAKQEYELYCPAHWYKLDPGLRARIWMAYRARNWAEHGALVDEAAAVIQKKVVAERVFNIAITPQRLVEIGQLMNYPITELEADEAFSCLARENFSGVATGFAVSIWGSLHYWIERIRAQPLDR